MIVCSCNVISDHEVRSAALSNPSGGMSHVYRMLGRKPDCGRCQRTIKEIACPPAAAAPGQSTHRPS